MCYDYFCFQPHIEATIVSSILPSFQEAYTHRHIIVFTLRQHTFTAVRSATEELPGTFYGRGKMQGDASRPGAVAHVY